MTRKIKLIAGAIVVVLTLFLLFLKLYIFRNSDTSVGSRKADTELNAGELIKSFETDELSANARYLNKVIEVKGIVDNIADTKNDITVYLKEKGKTAGVMCSFAKIELKHKTLKPGDTAIIKGVCNGYLMDVVLNKCAVVKQPVTP